MVAVLHGVAVAVVQLEGGEAASPEEKAVAEGHKKRELSVAS